MMKWVLAFSPWRLTEQRGVLCRSVPALPDCHTQARSVAALMKCVREAISLFVS